MESLMIINAHFLYFLWRGVSSPAKNVIACLFKGRKFCLAGSEDNCSLDWSFQVLFLSCFRINLEQPLLLC